jgi:hypothetical protein
MSLSGDVDSKRVFLSVIETINDSIEFLIYTFTDIDITKVVVQNLDSSVNIRVVVDKNQAHGCPNEDTYSILAL